MIPIFFHNISEISIGVGCGAVLLRFAMNLYRGKTLSLEQCIRLYLGGAMAPIGILLVAAGFVKDGFIEVIDEIVVYIALSGITVIYLSISCFRRN